jgi:hypothetical protein
MQRYGFLGTGVPGSRFASSGKIINQKIMSTSSTSATFSEDEEKAYIELPSRIIQIVAMAFPEGPNNGSCSKLIALCEDGSLWEQWHSFGYANVPEDGLWRLNYRSKK